MDIEPNGVTWGINPTLRRIKCPRREVHELIDAYVGNMHG